MARDLDELQVFSSRRAGANAVLRQR